MVFIMHLPCLRDRSGVVQQSNQLQHLPLGLLLLLSGGGSVGCNVLPPLAWTQEQACSAAGDEDCDGVRGCDARAPSPNCDCDDRQKDVYPSTLEFPAAIEYCDGKDNDCSGRPDDDPLQDPRYPDMDGDGYGDRSIELRCEGVVPGYIPYGGDCQDNPDAELGGFTTAFDIHPFAYERCNEVDDNCNDIVDGDDELHYSKWYPDHDGDGYGDEYSQGRTGCKPTITDSNLERENNYDCDDDNAKIGPDQAEVCDDDIDNNCDDIAVECDIEGEDIDGDGHDYYKDCNEQDADIYPGADETCNSRDDNCNGQIDENLSNEARPMFPDVDGDSFGDNSLIGGVTIYGCTVAGYVMNNDDCDDLNSAIRPGAVDVCNGIDDDCDLAIDEDPNRLANRDRDADQFGDQNSSILACTPPDGYVANSGDCDDSDPRINPNATVCLGSDSNCNDVPNTEDPLMTDKTCGLSFDRYIAPPDSKEPIPCECMPQYTRIQAAIDAALEGEVLGIEAGEYLEMLSLKGKAITLRGIKGPALTILNAEQRGTAVLINSGEGLETYLEDMTIKGGVAPATDPVSEQSFGGGIRIENASPQLSGLWIVNNQASAGGGGIAVIGGSPILQQLVVQGNVASEGAGIHIDLKSFVQLSHAVISDNAASVNGGAISLLDSILTLENALIVNNAAAPCGTNQGYGGGVHVNFSAYLLGSQLHVMDNSACTGGGIALLDGKLTLDGSILAKNSASDDPNLYAAQTSVSVELTDSLLWNLAMEDVSEAPALASGSSIASDCYMDDLNCLHSSSERELDFWILKPTSVVNSPYVMTSSSPNIPGVGVIPGAYGGSGKVDWDLNRDGLFAWYEPTDQWPPVPSSDNGDTEDIPLIYIPDLD